MQIPFPLTRPDTYFLQRALDRGLDAVAARLDHEAAYRPFFYLHLAPEPRLEHQIWDLGDMCSRYVDAYILGRQVTGYAGGVEEEQALRTLLATADPYANPFLATRMALAFVDEYLQEPWPEARRRVDDLVRTIRAHMTFEKDYAFFFKPPEGWASWKNPIYGSFTPYPTYPVGGIILALARYLEVTEAPEAEDLVERLTRFVLRESGTFAPDGKFLGHTHSGGILTAAAGILRWAIRQGNEERIAQMRGAFDWMLRFSSSFGWVPDDLGPDNASGETCAFADAIHLGLLLARRVDPSYYSIIERFGRNQLIENQFRKPARALPKGKLANRERLSRALDGSWASWSRPNSLDNCLKGVEGCCLGAGIRALYLLWEGAITCEQGRVAVHMAFSRNSPWVEVISHQPYEGRVDLIVHNARRLAVRLPDWVRPEEPEITVNGALVPLVLNPQHYVEINELVPDDVVTLTYPLRQVNLRERISGNDYRVRWRGDTVTRILPKSTVYPLYERDWMEEDAAPLLHEQPYAAQTGGPVHW